MQKKLAITMAGAVSLGSYEAGVLFEVLDAITQHNDSAPSDDDRILIDVITGASAGGMTAAILAHKLLYCAKEFKGPYDNPLYSVWVKRISLAGLQAPGDGERAIDSIFSSDLIDAISKEELTARYAGPAAPVPADKHAAVGDEIRVGLALTNLNGVAYGYDVKPSGKFVYIDYCDQMTRKVNASPCDRAEFWEDLRRAAVACGAFPFAFRAQDLQRSANREPDDYPPGNLEHWGHDPTTFTYSDGGILQNQPLGIAKNLVDQIDCHLNEKRFYLFVSPNAKDPDTNDTFHAASADYLRLLKRLVGVFIGQAGFQDWVTAKHVNESVAILDSRAAGLKDAIQAGGIEVPALAKTAEAILALFFKDALHIAPGATKPETLPDAQDRIGIQYQAEMTALGSTSMQARAFRDAVLAFETAAGLGARDYMTIYGVTADDSELAGGGLQAFLGFFDQSFRDHDYDVGRAHAQTILKGAGLSQVSQSQPVALGPLRYTPAPVRPIDSRLNGLKLRDVPTADLQGFKAGMRKRLNEMLKEVWPPLCALPATPVADLILDSLLNYLIARW
ncbi:MAG: patatin-like phospholipase family protein [Terriglobales bacterium]